MPRRALNQPIARMVNVLCECGRPAVRQVLVRNLVSVSGQRERQEVEQWMPLCEACYRLHVAVEAGATGRALAAALAAHEQEMHEVRA